MKNEKQAVAASVTVYRVADMTTKGRKAVCGWLRKLADDLQNEPETFAKTFRARYLYLANVQATTKSGRSVTLSSRPLTLRNQLGHAHNQPDVIPDFSPVPNKLKHV